MSLVVPLVSYPVGLWKVESIKSFSELKRKVHAIYNAHSQLYFPLEKSRRDGMRTIPKNSLLNNLGIDKTIYIGKNEELYLILETISNGTFSRVKKIQSMKSGQYFALSRSKLRDPIRSKEAERVSKYSKILNKKVGCVESYDIKTYKSIEKLHEKQMVLMKYYSNRDMFGLENSISLEDRFDLCLGPALGLLEMHKLGILHCDIKLENIFWEKGLRGYRAVLGDYGGSQFEADDLVATGTYQYKSPEFFRSFISNLKYVPSRRDDIWALGIVFVEVMITNPQEMILIDRITSISRKIGQSKSVLDYTKLSKRIVQLQIFLEGDPNPILKLASQMLSIIPEKRPTIQEVVDVLKQQYLKAGREPPFESSERRCCCTVL